MPNKREERNIDIWLWFVTFEVKKSKNAVNITDSRLPIPWAKHCQCTGKLGDGEVHRFKSLPITKKKAKRVSPTVWCGSFVMNVMGLLVHIMIYHI